MYSSFPQNCLLAKYWIFNEGVLTLEILEKYKHSLDLKCFIDWALIEIMSTMKKSQKTEVFPKYLLENYLFTLKLFPQNAVQGVFRTNIGYISRNDWDKLIKFSVFLAKTSFEFFIKKKQYFNYMTPCKKILKKKIQSSFPFLKSFHMYYKSSLWTYRCSRIFDTRY